MWPVSTTRTAGALIQDSPAAPRHITRPGTELGQPVSEQDHAHPRLGGQAQGAAVLHADQRVVGQPDRGAIRALAHLRPGWLRPPQPRRAGPADPRLPGLAQRQRPSPRRPGRPAPRTRPHPQRTPATLGPAPAQSRVIKTGKRTWTPPLATASSGLAECVMGEITGGAGR